MVHYSQILRSIPDSVFWHLEKLTQFIILRSSHSGRIHYEHSLISVSPPYSVSMCRGTRSHHSANYEPRIHNKPTKEYVNRVARYSVGYDDIELQRL